VRGRGGGTQAWQGWAGGVASSEGGLDVVPFRARGGLLAVKG
jgi:hypothetical protein